MANEKESYYRQMNPNRPLTTKEKRQRYEAQTKAHFVYLAQYAARWTHPQLAI